MNILECVNLILWKQGVRSTVWGVLSSYCWIVVIAPLDPVDQWTSGNAMNFEVIFSIAMQVSELLQLSSYIHSLATNETNWKEEEVILPDETGRWMASVPIHSAHWHPFPNSTWCLISDDINLFLMFFGCIKTKYFLYFMGEW